MLPGLRWRAVPEVCVKTPYGVSGRSLATSAFYGQGRCLEADGAKTKTTLVSPMPLESQVNSKLNISAPQSSFVKCK